MSIKVGINGFGRIGRLVFRAGINRSDIEFVGINDPFMTPDYMAYMLRYDTMHGQFQGTIEYTDDSIIVNGKTVKFFACMNPAEIPWGSVDAEYVVESTGMFLTKEKAQAHIDAGAKKVVMSAPSKDDTPMFVMGVNHNTYDSSMQFRLQRLLHHQLPGSHRQGAARQLGHHRRPDDHRPLHHRHPEDRGRPLQEGLARRPRCLGQHHPLLHRRRQGRGQGYPLLNGKLTGMSMRVPTLDVSVVDLTVNLAKPAKYDEICAAMKAASEGELKGILGYTEDAVVSSDFLGDTRTSIFDATAGIALTDTFVKVVSWYDNEIGYSNKVLDLIAHMYSVDHK